MSKRKHKSRGDTRREVTSENMNNANNNMNNRQTYNNSPFGINPSQLLSSMFGNIDMNQINGLLQSMNTQGFDFNNLNLGNLMGNMNPMASSMNQNNNSINVNNDIEDKQENRNTNNSVFSENIDRNDENMQMLIEKVKETNADVGIAYDGDGDRIGIVLENGEYISADQFMIIIVKYLLPKIENKTILYDVKCSKSLEDEIKKIACDYVIMTDDGSYGKKGTVVDAMDNLEKYDECVAIGPVVMMKYVSLKTKDKVPTIVSMNPIMVDGTGMCGACRLIVDGEVKFACVDGPEFDGHQVDFDLAIERMNIYKTFEGRKYLEMLEGKTHHGGCGECNHE